MFEQSKVCKLKEGDAFSGFLLAQEVAFKTSSKGCDYLELRLSDVSGSIRALLWDLRVVENDLDLMQVGNFFMLKGQVLSYNGRNQLKIDKIRYASDKEVGELSNFFPTSQRSIEEMIDELKSILKSINDPWLARLLQIIFLEDQLMIQTFSQAPAAKFFHHSYLGGLIEHTLSSVNIAEGICKQYVDINRDIVITGLLLHDIGKTIELTYHRNFNYSDEGNLIGHISLAVNHVSKAIDQIVDFPDILRMMILHIILSHHGKLEYGSPIIPKTPEAILVHHIDDLDAKLFSAFKSINDDSMSDNTWTAFSRSLDSSFYKPRWPKN